jgi:hypothetical protein
LSRRYLVDRVGGEIVLASLPGELARDVFIRQTEEVILSRDAELGIEGRELGGFEE